MTDVNILDVVLEAVWDPLDDIVFILIFLSGVYWIFRVFTSGTRCTAGVVSSPVVVPCSNKEQNTWAL